MPAPYIPAKEGLMLTWMLTFSAGITAAPATYGLLAADATAIDTAVDAFDAAYAVALDPATRTPVTVNAKDNARNAALDICRQYAQVIKNDAGVADPDKIAIGVPPLNDSRTPIFVPATAPLLNIIAATPGAHTVRFADTNTPDSGAKPFGAIQLQLFVAIGETPAVNPDVADFYAAMTRNPVAVAFGAGDEGKVATYFARWCGRRGDVGPWSLPVSMTIAF